MFKKILIANRGEIAIRILSTCREMGIQTVAVYSEVDRNAAHVLQADEAYLIGPAPASESYLRIDTILQVARESGAQAIHPGYGFLSENAEFVEACERAGIVFIGPPAAVMRLMGSKISAKRLATSVEAPTVPGYNGERQDDATLLREAKRIGFPLLIKASAGGGGKGMREVHAQADFLEQLAGARREAKAAFGDETVFIERLLLQPRHVEIQILGDRYGHVLHLGERECSIQRRHQKIIEESPSTALTPALRTAMSTAAVNIARAAGYINAGTIEFILDTEKHFYFLEMNTRLQVEHPVTELITGLDLVRHQLYIAAGEPLKLKQEQITQRGHAIEVRIYAEDPTQQFLPSTGTLSHVIKPEGPGIRVDSGVEDGDAITQYYDPMIAKLIVYGEDRSAALARLQQALEHSAIFGVTTNIPLLYRISQQDAFRAGELHTHFLEEHHLLNDSESPTAIPAQVLYAAALYESLLQETPSPTDRRVGETGLFNPWQHLGPWRMRGERRIFTYKYHEHEYSLALRLIPQQPESWQIQIDQQEELEVSGTLVNHQLLILQQGTQRIRTYVQLTTEEIQIFLKGESYRLRRRVPPEVNTNAHGGHTTSSQRTLRAPMAGTIVKIHVHPGEQVAAHQVLMILSAMKMEHAITAPYEGRVQRIHYQEGAVVPGGSLLIEME